MIYEFWFHTGCLSGLTLLQSHDGPVPPAQLGD